MRFLIVISLLFSFSLMSKSDVANETDDAYYSDEDRDSVVIDQNEEVVENSKEKADCNCDVRQAEEEAPVYIMLPEPILAPPVQPASIDYSRPQVGPDYYRQFQSGNYQFLEIPSL